MPRLLRTILYFICLNLWLPWYPIFNYQYYFYHQIGFPIFMFLVGIIAATDFRQFIAIFSLTLANYMRQLHWYEG